MVSVDPLRESDENRDPIYYLTFATVSTHRVYNLRSTQYYTILSAILSISNLVSNLLTFLVLQFLRPLVPTFSTPLWGTREPLLVFVLFCVS